MVLLMSVNPGLGPKIYTRNLNKLRLARKKIDAYTEKTGKEIWLEVDGWVNADNITEIAKLVLIHLLQDLPYLGIK